MSERPSDPGRDEASRFAEELQQKKPGMIREMWGLIRDNKKWWLTPVIVMALLLGAFMLLFSSPLSPLIYTLF
jgi:hypothetical protein